MNRIVLFLLAAFLLGGVHIGYSQSTFTISGGTTMTVNGGTNFNILGNIQILSTGAIDNSGTITMSGDWTNNSGSTGLINSSPGMVRMSGDTQTIGGSDLTRFYDLELSGTGIKMLAVHSEAEGVLDLTDRELRTDTFDMFVSNSSDTSIQRTSGYVSSSGNGRLSRNTASTNTYLFPVGDPANGGTYRPVELTPANTAANTFDVRFVNNDPTTDGYNRANRDSSFCTVNDGFYHFIEQSSGTSSTDIRMYYDTATDGSFTQIGGWLNVPQWQNTSTATTGQANGQDYVDVSTWNDFTFGVFALGRGVEKPQIIASGPLTFCAPGSITLTTSISYDTIVWSTGSTADTITVSSTSDVFAVVSDQNGCSAISDTVNIVVQPLPSAGFTSTTAGFTANFTNISLNGTTYTWDFGDGNGSTATNPSHTYSANGTYTVCLIATNSCGNDTTCKSVVINCPTPTTNFTYLTNNLSVNFSDNSTGGATSYTWDFGDGNGTTGANVAHTYSLPGTYTVCLVTQNSCGFDTACQNVTVTCPAPNAAFTFSSNNLVVNFTNTTTGGATSYAWDFGDGNASTSASPSHTFATPGTYTVCLISTSVCGSDTSCQNVTVTCPVPVSSFGYTTNNLQVSFTNSSTGANSYTWFFGDGNSSSSTTPIHTYSSPGTYQVCLISTNSCGNDTTCQNVTVSCPVPSSAFTFSSNNLVVNFTNTTTGGATSYAWDFGDGNASTSTSPSHTFATPGTYTVCLISTSICGSDTTCQNVTVTCPVPVAGFGYNTSNLQVSFTNSSTGAASYTWFFGDGNSASAPTPTHTYTSPGTYQVCLIATNSCGNDTTCQNVTVSCPVPNGSFGFNANNLSVSFTNSTTGASSYFWDFGDGNSSTGATPTHNYAATGTYTVCLISTNSCGNDTTCQNITVTCPAPNGSFTYNTTNLSASFTNNTSNASSYFWDLGDGNTSTMTSPTHTYGAPGNYTVCLISTNSCGNDTTCQTVNVQCPLPTSGFGFNANNLAVSFSNSSVNASGYSWDFGDGNSSNQTTPTHNYSAPGTYTVCLIALNNCGNDTFCQNINVVCPIPNGAFGFNNNGLIATFTNNSTNANSYSWDFGDGSNSTIPNPSHTYSGPGTYTVCMIATNSCGNDTICQNVTVSCTLPVSAYTYSTSNQTVNFTDQSTNGPTSWLWDFGDGNTSNLQNVSYTFAQPGTYNVCLITTNNCGSDTACQQVNVTCPQPRANFSFNPANLTVNFNDLSVSGITNWNWNFGDGNSSTLQNPSHKYAAAGTYQVCLIAGNACGSDTICRTVTVTCVQPVAGFTNSISNLTVTFSDISAYTPTSWFWEFGDGNNSTQQNPVHVYATAGSYQVCLNVDNDCGSDKTCRVINIETTGITDLTDAVNMEVYPNPASNLVEVHADASNQKVRSVTMMDALGKTIKVEHVSNSNEVDLRWKVSDLAAGVYLIQVQFEDGVATKRLVVSH